MKPRLRRSTGGFSLLELLIALSLSAVLTTLVYQIWLQNQERRNQMNEEAALQANGRMALHILRQFIQKAGYIDWSALPAPLPQTLLDSMQSQSQTALQARFGAAETAIEHFFSGDNGYFVATSNQQALEIRYSENGFDCLGQNTQASSPTRLQFFIKSSAGIPNLYCRNTQKGTPQPIIEGVEEMGFSFLEGSQWRSAPTASARVRALHLCLILSSPSHRSAGNAALQTKRPTCALTTQGLLSQPNDYAPDVRRGSKDHKRWIRVASIVHLPNNLLLKTP